MRRYLFVLLFAVPFIVSAQTVVLTNPAPGVGSSMWDFIAVLIQIARWVVVPTIALVIVYSGFEMVTAKGDMKKIATAKQRLLGAVIAAAVVFSAELIVNIARGTGTAIVGN